MKPTKTEEKLSNQVKQLLSDFCKKNKIENLYLSGDIYPDVALEKCYIIVVQKV